MQPPRSYRTLLTNTDIRQPTNEYTSRADVPRDTAYGNVPRRTTYGYNTINRNISQHAATQRVMATANLEQKLTEQEVSTQIGNPTDTCRTNDVRQLQLDIEMLK